MALRGATKTRRRSQFRRASPRLLNALTQTYYAFPAVYYISYVLLKRGFYELFRMGVNSLDGISAGADTGVARARAGASSAPIFSRPREVEVTT